jgi:hypothetical protein
VLIGGENQVAAEGTIETAAASSGTATIAAKTIGCSIPSSSQTGVRTTATYPSILAVLQRRNVYLFCY